LKRENTPPRIRTAWGAASDTHDKPERRDGGERGNGDGEGEEQAAGHGT